MERMVNIKKRRKKAQKYMGRCESLHEIEVGHVYKIVPIRREYNELLDVTCDHQMYVWLQSDKNRKKMNGIQPKFRKMRVCTLYIPLIPGKEMSVIVRSHRVQAKYLTELLSQGYDIIATNIKYYYTDDSYKRLYKAVGLI